MKILIDLTGLSANITGVGRYTICITEEILKADKTNEFILLFRNHIYPSFEKYIDNKRIVSKVIKGSSKIIFMLLKLPFKLYKIKADKYLFLHSKSPLFFYNKNIYNTIHDLVCWDCPQTMLFVKMIYSRILSYHAIRVSKKIIAVSEFTKKRIVEKFNYSEDNIIVSYEGVSSSFCANIQKDFYEIKKKYHLPDKYIMNLSTLEPRKNLQLLLKAFEKVSPFVDYDLVLIGKKGWKINKFYKKMINNPRIHLTGYIEDNDIKHIYIHSLCFVFPSLYEGFGLPPIEALSLGTPVLSSNAASLPEVLRKQARYFENNDLHSLKEELLHLNENINTMPKSLDDFQNKNFNFTHAAKEILNCLY